MPIKPPTHQYKHQAVNKKHQQREYNRTSRKNQSFYGSQKWRRVSEWHRNQHPLCEHCKQQGRATQAKVVDHIVEIQDGGAPLDASNLQSLCTSCHNTKTAQARTERGRAG